MNDVQQWIEERRAIHAKAAEGPWEFEPDDTDDWTVVDGVNDYIGHSPDDGVRAGFEQGDATAIVDAHNMFPRALNALNAALELHVKGYETAGVHWCSECETKWPCPTVQAIEGAIND